MTFHKKISFVKSVLRIIGFLLIPFSIWGAIGAMVLAELLGIAEEWGE